MHLESMDTKASYGLHQLGNEVICCGRREEYSGVSYERGPDSLRDQQL